MERSDGLHHACPACAGAPALGGGAWSRRSLLRLGLVAGVGAATAKISPAFARAVGAVEGEVGAPGAALLHSALPQQPNFPAPSIVTRAQWGCNEALRKPGQTYNSLVEKIVVHHTVTPNNPSDPAAVVRSVYNYDVSGVYIDMAYHFLIDQHGRIYEGRWARDYPAGVPHTGENSAHANVQGAATLGHNPRTIAVAMLGTFTSVLPTAEALSSLVTVLAWKCARWGIDPRGSTPYLNDVGGLEVFPDILGHRTVYPTICPGDPIMARLALIRDEVDIRVRNGLFGYWIAGVDGRTHVFGDVPDVGDPHRLGLSSVIQAITAHPGGLGYWALGTDGGVFTFGSTRFFGSTGGIRLNQPVVGMAATRTGNGYWLVARDGGIFCFGDARFFGSTGGIRLNQPVVGMAPTPSGNGYWLVARDGGIFCFGDARFLGSTGGIHLNQPIVAMCVTPTGNGYRLVARDGGIFCFGDAGYYGSGPGRGLRVPAVAAASTTTGRGYALLAADGTVLPFGDARSYGNAVGVGPVVGFAGRLLP
jgi:N-acetylmuramoyl-L-alanine amidase